MPARPMSLDVMREALELVAEHGNVGVASRAIGIADATLRKRYQAGLRAAERGEFGTSPVIPSFRISQTTAVTNQDGETVREFIQQRPERGGAYEPASGLSLKGKTTFVDVVGDERRVTREVYLERLIGGHSPDMLIDALKNVFDDVPARPPVKLLPESRKGYSNLLSVYPLIDWHVGLRAWAQETGEDYDLNIGRESIMPAMRRLIAATPPADEAVILGIGDLLHFDGFVQETPSSGHPLDGDGRYPKVLETAADMVEETIELALAHHKRVTVRILRGNHDPVSATAVSMALRRVFRQNKRVTIDVSHAYQWWFRRGKVFLGGSHGDKAKMRDLPMVMAHDRPEDWAASTYRKIYTGHIHHESKIEEGGVIVESMRSPVAKDAYHSFNKWRSGRSVYSETFDIDGSEAATLQFNL